jgi:hypothetical protein
MHTLKIAMVFLVLTLFGLGSSELASQVGSGKPAAKKIKVAGFDSLEIRMPMNVKVNRGESFSTSINGDDNLIGYVKVKKEGSTLKISMEKENWAGHLGATITMPSLKALDLGGTTTVTIKGFKSADPFKVKLADAATLKGAIDAGELTIDGSGSSSVNLKGSAKEATLTAKDACRLELGGFKVDSANLKVTDASRAALFIKTKLDYVLADAARLEYQGSPTVGKAEVSGVASVKHK